MSERVFSLGMGLIVLATISVIVGGSLYGCQQANQNYYAFAEQCVKQGGTWVPTGNDGYNGVCAHSNAQVRP